MPINLKGKYFIDADEYNYMLCKKVGIHKNSGQPINQIIFCYPHLDSLINRIIESKFRESIRDADGETETAIQLLLLKMEEVKEFIKENMNVNNNQQLNS